MSNSEQINNQKMNRGSVEEERLVPHSTETKRELYKYIRIGITAFVTFVCCILFFFIILRYKGFADTWKKIISTAQPIIIGLILAYLLNPVMKFFESHLLKFLKPHMKSERKAKKTARALGVTGAILFLLVIIGLLIAAIVPSVINSIISLADTLPGNVQSFISWIDGQSFGDTEVTNMIGDCMTKATDFVENWFRNTFLPQANTFITEITSGVISFVKGILNFIIGIIVAVYVMMIKETLTGQSKKIIYSVCNPKTGNIIIEMIRKSNEIFGGFVTGKILDSAIIGVICYIGCLILKMPDCSDCWMYQCYSVFRTVYRGNSGTSSGCDPESDPCIVSADIYHCPAAGGRKYHWTEDSWRFYGTFVLLGYVCNPDRRRNVGICWYGAWCSGVCSHLLYHPQTGCICTEEEAASN